MTEKNELQTTESPLAAAAALVAANGQMDVEKLGKLLEMNERYEANEAKKAYVAAMAEFKKNPPEIIKDKNVSYSTQKGTTNYNHATLHNVTMSINKALSIHGLTASWVTSQLESAVKVICKITHIMGHSEETSLAAPPDGSGNKNPIQAIGSTVTYLERYTLLALTGLATHDQDDDGKGADKPKPKPVTPKDSMVFVDQAFVDFEMQNQEYLANGDGKIKFDLDLFIKAIYKHFKSLPTKPESIPKIVKEIKPEEVSVTTGE